MRLRPIFANNKDRSRDTRPTIGSLEIILTLGEASTDRLGALSDASDNSLSPLSESTGDGLGRVHGSLLGLLVVRVLVLDRSGGVELVGSVVLGCVAHAGLVLRRNGR